MAFDYLFQSLDSLPSRKLVIFSIDSMYIPIFKDNELIYHREHRGKKLKLASIYFTLKACNSKLSISDAHIEDMDLGLAIASMFFLCVLCALVLNLFFGLLSLFLNRYWRFNTWMGFIVHYFEILIFVTRQICRFSLYFKLRKRQRLSA